MKSLVLAMLLSLPISVGAADFSDDFESYNIGDDLDASVNWDRDDEGGQLLVADDSGNKVAVSMFGGNAYVGYACDGAALVTDTTISIDFKFDGYNCGCGLMARGQSGGEEAYIGAIMVVYPGVLTYVSIQYVEENFTLTELYTGIGPALSAGTWHNMEFTATGENPVSLELYLNGSSVAEYDDSAYLLGAGWVGIGCAYDSAPEPDFWFDDFNVDENPTGIKTASLGQIKAIYR